MLNSIVLQSSSGTCLFPGSSFIHSLNVNRVHNVNKLCVLKRENSSLQTKEENVPHIFVTPKSLNNIRIT